MQTKLPSESIEELSEESLTTLSKSDMYFPSLPMAHQSFLLFRLAPSKQYTDATEFGLLPTPLANKQGGKSGVGFGKNLQERVRELIPTPLASDYKRARGDGASRNTLPAEICRINTDTSNTSQRINPRLYELLMGFPEGWCELTEARQSKRWVMQSYRRLRIK
jgi:hypothetical protein